MFNAQCSIIFVPLQIMRKIALILMLALALPQNGIARNIRDLFTAMPESLMPILSENARKDLMDIYESGMRASLQNEWNGRTTLLKMSDNHIQLQEDSEGVVKTDLLMLTGKKDTIVCMVRTLCIPEQDSELLFYNTNWQQLNTKQYLSDLPQGFTDDDMTLISVETTIGASLTITRNGKDKTSYTWNGKKFVKDKE